jgi:hypothetical protein
MAYGASVLSGNGFVQLDSSTTNSGLTVVDSGTISSTGSINFKKSTQFLFCRPTASTVTSMGMVQTSSNSGGSEAVQTYEIRNSSGSRVPVDYVLGQFSSSLTANTAGYGIQIFNSDGDLAFDSQQYNGDGGFGLTDYVEAGTFAGFYNFIDGDQTKYTLMNGTFGNVGLGFNSFIGVVYTGTTTGSLYSSGTGIYYLGYLTIFNGASYFPNWGSIFLGKGGSV